MITFVLADAQIELVPAELHGASSVKRRARERRRPQEHLLLDQAMDHRAMVGLAGHDRRGRPDIAHFALLLIQDSPLREKRVLIHTRDDALVTVRPDMRPPRSQARFYQLCEDLLRQGAVPEKGPLMTLERGVTLSAALAREARGPVVMLDEAGEPARSAEFARVAREHADVTLVLGAFPRGAWRERPAAAHVWRVSDAPVPAWSALVPALAGFEDAQR